MLFMDSPLCSMHWKDQPRRANRADLMGGRLDHLIKLLKKYVLSKKKEDMLGVCENTHKQRLHTFMSYRVYFSVNFSISESGTTTYTDFWVIWIQFKTKFPHLIPCLNPALSASIACAWWLYWQLSNKNCPLSILPNIPMVGEKTVFVRMQFQV